MEITDIIKLRHSTRTYKPVLLTEEDKQSLQNIINNESGLFGQKITFSLVENTDPSREMKLNYGGIKGHRSYLLGTITDSIMDRVQYGYQGERILLQATGIGMASCWIGYFDNTFFSHITLEKGHKIPAIIILGYAKNKPSVADRFSRFAVKADKRHNAERLFFNHTTGAPLKNNIPQPYDQLLEMVRLAPSAGNMQPWRIYYDDGVGEFHFYKEVVNEKYEGIGMHEIDLGIAAAHFEMTAEALQLKGQWEIKESAALGNRNPLQYILSWSIA